MRAISVRQDTKRRGSCQNSERSAALMEICAVLLIGVDGSTGFVQILERPGI